MFVVVPEYMQQAVEGKSAKFDADMMPSRVRLSPGYARCDDDIAQRPETKRPRDRAAVGWEGEHVRCSVPSPEPPVECPHLGVTHQRNG